LGTLAALGLGLVSPQATAAEDVDLQVSQRAISISMDHEQAVLIYRFALRGKGELTEDLMLPGAAVATGLRVVLRGAPARFATLQDSAVAEASFEAETAGKVPTVRVLLSHLGAADVSLRVVGSDDAIEAIEVSALAPLEYAGGKYTLDTSRLDRGSRVGISLMAADPKETVMVEGAPSQGFVLTPQHTPNIELRPLLQGPFSASLGSFPVGGQHVIRGNVAAPESLGAAPRGAHVALVLDRSWSADSSWEESKIAARSYLQSMPDANVEIVTFNRKASTPFGRNLPVAQAIAALEAGGPEAGNGSRMDDALALADTLLAASPIKERRIVVLSDFAMRPSLEASRVAARSWASGAIVHFATVKHGGGNVSRDDGADWAAVPRRTGGLFYRADAPGEVTPDTVSAFEEWARPKHIGRFALTGVPSTVYEAPPELAAGQEASFFALSPVAATELTLQGEVWSKPFRHVVRATPQATQRAKVFAFGGTLLDDVPEDQRRALARAARVVSPETSFYFERPGAREPTGGSISVSGFSSHSSCGCRMGIGTQLVGSLRTDRERFLAAELQGAKNACGAAQRPITVHLETTLHEIVDLRATDTSPVPSAVAVGCVEEKLWDAVLPGDFTEARAVYTVQ
jgi:hypothetical protein